MHIPESIYKDIVNFLPILCVDLLIIYDDRCLLIRRINHPACGQFWFPGGRVHKNETLSAAATRISIEETGLICNFERILSVEETIFFKNDENPSDKHTVNICCKMHPVTPVGTIKLDRFHDAFEWVRSISPDLHEAVKRPLSTIGFT
jgi:ADP-ribose pyrophosphatase YjhB (NUDIX family)